jgi:hypothetical protein
LQIQSAAFLFDRDTNLICGLVLDSESRLSSVALGSQDLIPTVQDETNACAYVISADYCISVLENSFVLFFRSTGNSLISGKTNGKITAAVVNGTVIGTLRNGFEIDFWSTEDISVPFTSVSSYRGRVLCFEASGAFDLISLGVKNYLELYSLSKGVMLNIIEINGIEPKLIRITPGWGFVLVYGESEVPTVVILNVNGERIRSVEMPHRFSLFHVFTSRSGFDYAVVCGDDGKMILFEAYYCQSGEQIFASEERIVTFSIIPEQSRILASLETRAIALIAIPLR